MNDWGSGDWRPRSIRYGQLVKKFDDTASADDMQLCADSRRAAYNTLGQEKRNQLIADAAYCQAAADRKRNATK